MTWQPGVSEVMLFMICKKDVVTRLWATSWGVVKIIGQKTPAKPIFPILFDVYLIMTGC